jgi:hypothetical protein
MRDQIEDFTTQLSNLRGHKGNGSRNPCTERRTQGRQHLVQAPTSQRVSRFKLKIPKFKRDQQLPKEYLDWVLAVEEVLSSMGCLMNDKSLWWYIHFEEELLHSGNN